MKQPFRMQKTFLALLLLLMGSFVWVLASSLQFAWQKPHQKTETEKDVERDWGEIASESEVFRSLENHSKWASAENSKKVKGRESNRAYPGAPPQIPHKVSETVGASGKQCLSCHAQGGYSQKFKAYAPVAPHPQYTSCRQCHTVQTVTGLFRETVWNKKPAVRGFAHLKGGPPVIPHPLHLRGNCLSCHAGPSAISEIRTTHPDRVNCRQCHVPVLTETLFSRSGFWSEK